jgi:hypothetical protein
MALALIAIAIRAAVPVGFMLTPDKDRWVVVTLCSGSGPMQMALNLDTGEQRRGGEQPAEEDPQPSPHAPCVFTVSAGVTPPVEVAVARGPVGAFMPIGPTFPVTVAIGQGLAAPPPWSTGPPAAV